MRAIRVALRAGVIVGSFSRGGRGALSRPRTPAGVVPGSQLLPRTQVSVPRPPAGDRKPPEVAALPHEREDPRLEPPVQYDLGSPRVWAET
ncbi:hypothetical protein GCM10022244_09090 [Streptomyces gulbargensis]|uniref:Uncharacterized protein n=1 Tax=Streptomyces gulbargensis TaxID=364901 RepID=A0ABP7LL98_9ACTN